MVICEGVVSMKKENILGSSIIFLMFVYLGNQARAAEEKASFLPPIVQLTGKSSAKKFSFKQSCVLRLDASGMPLMQNKNITLSLPAEESDMLEKKSCNSNRLPQSPVLSIAGSQVVAYLPGLAHERMK